MSGLPDEPPTRFDDLYRHLEDLRTRTYEGAVDRADREAIFADAVQLMDPLVQALLDEANRAFLDGTGETSASGVHGDGAGGSEATWSLSWPEQRAARDVRGGGGQGVPPVQVVAWFSAGFNHPHLRGTSAGNWPLQVTSEADARRQEPIVRAIVEAELHERVFQGTWRIVSRFVRERAGGD